MCPYNGVFDEQIFVVVSFFVVVVLCLSVLRSSSEVVIPSCGVSACLFLKKIHFDCV